MSGFSFYGRRNILNYYIKQVAFTPPATVAIRLHTGPPGPNGTANAASQDQRRALGGLANSLDLGHQAIWSAGSVPTWNPYNVTGGGTETISHFSLWSSATAGAGNCLLTGPLGVQPQKVATIISGTFTSPGHLLSQGHTVQVYPLLPSALPSGLAPDQSYYVASATSTTFTLTAGSDPGGAAVTTSGGCLFQRFTSFSITDGNFLRLLPGFVTAAVRHRDRSVYSVDKFYDYGGGRELLSYMYGFSYSRSAEQYMLGQTSIAPDSLDFFTIGVHDGGLTYADATIPSALGTVSGLPSFVAIGGAANTNRIDNNPISVDITVDGTVTHLYISSSATVETYVPLSTRVLAATNSGPTFTSPNHQLAVNDLIDIMHHDFSAEDPLGLNSSAYATKMCRIATVPSSNTFTLKRLDGTSISLVDARGWTLRPITPRDVRAGDTLTIPASALSWYME